MLGSSEGVKSQVTESEATALLNRLSNIEDIAVANKHRSKNIRESMFGLTPPDDQPMDGKVDSECWFTIVNAKLDKIHDSIIETSKQLERTYNGMQF